MNTDNVSLVGETIDYGPCAFLDEFDRAKVFSSIDQFGRYAYYNQPRIGHWNMAMFAQAILPLLSSNEEEAISFAQTAVDQFPQCYRTAYIKRMREKYGLPESSEEQDITLMSDYLDLMQADSVDFTLSFRALTQKNDESLMDLFNDKAAISDWYSRWQKRVGGSHDTERMQLVNPAVVPRNHWVEATIESATNGDWDLFKRFEKALATPFVEDSTFSKPPEPEQRVQATFCGT